MKYIEIHGNPIEIYGNPLEIQEKSMDIHGKAMDIHFEIHGNPSESHRKSMGNPWEIHGDPRKSMELPSKSTEIHGRSRRNPWKSVGPAQLGSARHGLARPSICQRFATDLLTILQQFANYSPPMCRRFADIYHRRSTDEPVYRRADYCTTWDFLSLYFGWIWI